MLIVCKDDDDKLILISYEKLFEVRFYCGRTRIEADSCPEEEVNDGCFMIKYDLLIVHDGNVLCLFEIDVDKCTLNF